MSSITIQLWKCQVCCIYMDGHCFAVYFTKNLSARLPHVVPVKPSMSETTALGAAMAAGAAEGVDVWSLSTTDHPHVNSEKYEPQINSDGKKTKPRGKCGWTFQPLELLLYAVFTQCSVSPCLMCSYVESEFRFARWKKAVKKSMNWESTEPCCDANGMQLSYLKDAGVIYPSSCQSLRYQSCNCCA